MLIVEFPFDYESSFSYFIRMAKANHCAVQDLYRIAGVHFNKDTPYLLLKEEMEIGGDLVNLIGNDQINHQYFMVKSEDLKYYRGSKVEIFGQCFESFLISGRLKVCPFCMNSKKYLSYVWMFVHITSCLEHNCMLLDVCPYCKKTLNFNTWILEGCSSCKKNWSELTSYVQHIVSSDCNITHLLEMKLLNADKNETESSDNKPLSQMGYAELTKILSLTAWVLPSTYVFWNYNHIDSLEMLEDLHKLIQLAAEVYSNWPVNFHAFLDTIQSSNRYYRKTNFKNKESAPGTHRTQFGDFYTKLYELPRSEGVDEIKEQFEIYLKDNWSSGHIRKFNMRRSESSYYTSSDALYKYGIPNHKFKKYITEGIIEGMYVERKNHSFYLAYKKSLDEFMTNHYNTLSSEQASTLLGINHERLLKDFVNAKLIVASRGPTIDGYPHWRFDEKSIQGLLESIEERVDKPNKHLEKPQSLFAICRTLKGGYAPQLVDVVIKILNGKITPISVNQNAIGLGRFMIYKSDVELAFQAELKNKKGDKYSLTELAKKLMMSSNRLSYLIKEGFFEHEIGSNGYITVSSQAMEVFKKKYITLGEIIKLTKKGSSKLILYLKKEGIVPVNPKKDNESHQYVYKRDRKLVDIIAKILSENDL